MRVHAAARPQPRAHSRQAERRIVCAALDYLEAQFECAKATQQVVDVKTPLGSVQYRVPAGKRELEASPQRERWLEADRKALQAILSAPGNRLVPTSLPARLGLPIARTVTTRKIKVD